MCGSNCCIKHWLELRNDPIGTQLMHAHQLVGLSTCTDKDTSSTSLLVPKGHRERASCYRDQRNVTDDTVGRERERGRHYRDHWSMGGVVEGWGNDTNDGRDWMMNRVGGFLVCWWVSMCSWQRKEEEEAWVCPADAVRSVWGVILTATVAVLVDRRRVSACNGELLTAGRQRTSRKRCISLIFPFFLLIIIFLWSLTSLLVKSLASRQQRRKWKWKINNWRTKTKFFFFFQHFNPVLLFYISHLGLWMMNRFW